VYTVAVGRTAVVATFVCAVLVAAAPVARAQVTNVSHTDGLAEGEETVAINPTDHQNVIVGSNQWLPPTPSNTGNFGVGPSGATTCAVWSSHDGGRTWKGGRLENAGIDQLAGGALKPPADVPSEFGKDADAGNAISADQNTVFDRRGNAYYQCINFGIGDQDPKVFVYRSTNGGRTWGPPREAFDEVKTKIQIDRSFLAIDDSGGSRDGTLYLTFETMFYQAYLPEVYARRSTDGGKTWGPVVRVDDNDNRAQWDPRQYPVVGADGTLYVVYDAATLLSPAPIDPQATPLRLMVASSSDGGRTFRHSVVEPHVSRIASPDEAFSYFTETISALATDPRHAGRVAVAWPDKRSGEARILLRYSTDGARTWSSPIDAADDPAGKGNQHDHVALTYLPDGHLVVMWRDRRNGGGSFGGPFDVFARVFDVSSAGKLTPGRTVRYTEKPQPDGQNTHGSMPTEYLGLTSDRSGVAASWDEMRGSYLDNVFRRVPVSKLVPSKPSRHGCRAHRKRRFHIHQPWHGRIVTVTAYIDGRRVKRVHGHRVTRLVLRHLPPGRFHLRIVALAANGQRTISYRTYRPCRKGRPHTVVRPPHTGRAR
jgi:BNR repeat protein